MKRSPLSPGSHPGMINKTVLLLPPKWIFISLPMFSTFVLDQGTGQTHSMLSSRYGKGILTPCRVLPDVYRQADAKAFNVVPVQDTCSHLLQLLCTQRGQRANILCYVPSVIIQISNVKPSSHLQLVLLVPWACCVTCLMNGTGHSSDAEPAIIRPTRQTSRKVCQSYLEVLSSGNELCLCLTHWTENILQALLVLIASIYVTEVCRGIPQPPFLQ
ncbi:hypothetical protein PAXRUDRAFT_270792 [Paxillus rubicundulus Ve08.2h10]|uniref:Uncharacterized protein n=1 Tax=Paxillus rubicundulus Ve08.2h10 TaxID=930991 RepID=A0A0D0ED15_9AGAM|nr:hypothetical protein PAXRUDRAFT_270792 [Paxillus rubicundulus Ve08.2h10]